MTPGTEVAAEIVAGAQYLGSTILLAQGAGGNNSVKDFPSDTLWIKASGVNLSQNSTTDAFVGLSLLDAEYILRDSALHSLPKHSAHEASVQRFVAAVRSGGGLRPSLETGMHVALPQRAVVHTHSVYINALSCMLGGRETVTVLPSHLWISYATPGLDLALAIEDAMVVRNRCAESLAIVLENHGFVAAASSSEEAIATSEDCVAAARDFFGPLETGFLAQEPPAQEIADLVERARLLSSGRSACTRLFRAGRFAMFRAHTDLLAGPALQPFVPDDVVYLGPNLWRASSRGHAVRLLDHLVDRCPRFCMVVPGKGMLFAGDSEALLDAMEESTLAHMLIALLISRKGVPAPMSAESINEIVAMESEEYRRGIAARLTVEAGRCKS